MATVTKRLRVLHEVYTSLPPVNCKGLCVASCSFIMLGEVEALNIEKATGTAPVLVEVAGHRMIKPADASGRCPYLVLGRCSIYEARPLICRLFGAAPGIACGHGCTADLPLTDDESGAMLRKVARL